MSERARESRAAWCATLVLHLVELEIGQEVFDSRGAAEGQHEPVLSPAQDRPNLVLLVVEVCLLSTSLPVTKVIV